MSRVACVQHAPEEGPGAVESWARRRGVDLTGFRADLGELPASGFDAVVLLGGPVRADAEAPGWLTVERAWLSDRVAAGQPVFGICLGGQLLAASLGAAVRRGPSEAGWVELAIEPGPGGGPTKLRALTWHDDTFDRPPGAARIASSAVWSEQGFRHGEGFVALQFHPEWTPEIVAALHVRYGRELPEGLLEAGDHERAHEFLEGVLDRWVGGASAVTLQACGTYPGCTV